MKDLLIEAVSRAFVWLIVGLPVSVALLWFNLVFMHLAEAVGFPEPTLKQIVVFAFASAFVGRM